MFVLNEASTMKILEDVSTKGKILDLIKLTQHPKGGFGGGHN